jgi:hypothetical protein
MNEEMFTILKKYLPSNIISKVENYVCTEPQALRTTLHFPWIKSHLNEHNLKYCATELIMCLQNTDCSTPKIFHLGSNNKNHIIMEPTKKRTAQMIYNFLIHIYQRHILSSLIKYILLKNILDKFKTSEFTKTHKGIFASMYKRLQEIVFEYILTAFNGSNYDVYLIINYLIIKLTRLRHKIKIYKKGSSLSTVTVKIQRNLVQDNIQSHSKKKKNLWLMNLYIKDIRNMVSSNLSLDKLGQLFSIATVKLIFPYHQATTIKVLKTTTSLHPHDDKYWEDSFTNKVITLEDRLRAQSIFEEQNFSNLYEYNTFYLSNDCLLLHSIVLTLFSSYLKDNINIFIRRNFSQSRLAFQQFFVVDPSKQISKTIAPKRINNTFYNYFFKKSITGGFTTSMVHGTVNESTIINEHLNYVDFSNLNPNVWPNFAIAPKSFKEQPEGISTIDIRSLYPSASVKPMPVGPPLVYTRLTQDDYHQISKEPLSSLNIKTVCCNVRNNGSYNQDIFYLLNKSPKLSNEYFALENYLLKLPNEVEILRFQSNFTALGQLYFGEYPIDGFLSYKYKGKLIMKLIQYNSQHWHGHRDTCPSFKSQEDITNEEKTRGVRQSIQHLIQHFCDHFNLVDVEIDYVEIYDCDYHHQPPSNCKNYLFPFKKKYSYASFLQQIYRKQLQGFIIVKNLELKKNAQNPIFGFLIQKIEYEQSNLSPYTNAIIKNFKSTPRVVGSHKAKSFFILSTQYFCWLKEQFDFETTPDIYHCILFRQDTYLKTFIEKRLLQRKQLKEQIQCETNMELKRTYEIKAELIKLLLNSCYGFTLCNVNSSRFKCLHNSKYITKKALTCLKLADQVYLIETKKTIDDSFQSLLGHVGSSILFHSKIILLKRLYYLLKYLNPTKAQLLYMDTDSAHFLLQHKKFSDNVDLNLRSEFIALFDKHFETGDKLSGIWVHEGWFLSGTYLGEKCYYLDKTLSHMKGLNKYLQKELMLQNIDPTSVSHINFNYFYKSPDFSIFRSFISKNIFQNMVPVKRYFVSNLGSLPLRLS